LLRVIVNGVKGSYRVLKTEAGAEIAAGDIVVGIALDAAIFEAGRDGLTAAAVNADATAGQRRSALGRDVEDARCVQAILRR